MFVIFIVVSLNYLTMSRAEPIAVTDTPTEFLNRFYKEERNDDPPYEWDRAYADPFTRRRICEDVVSRSGVFARYQTVDTRSVSDDLEIVRRNHPTTFDRIFERRSFPQPSYEYSNLYAPQEFEIASFSLEEDRGYRPHSFKTRDYVFVCLLKREIYGKIKFFLFHVSKAYNLVHDRRFIFMEHRVMLAETPARVYTRPDFNVELHYLELRKHYQPASRIQNDPVCKLNIEGWEGDQGFRLCVIALSSSYFEDRIKYLHRYHSNVCSFHKIAFRTAEVTENGASDAEPYYERMIQCKAVAVDSEGDTDFYISRAYQPMQVLVYVNGPSNHVYLENLSTNVGIVHEPYNFGDVEI